MKNILVSLMIILAVVGCSKKSDIITYNLEPLELNQDAMDLLQFYLDNKTIELVKWNSDSKNISDLEVWTMTRTDTLIKDKDWTVSYSSKHCSEIEPRRIVQGYGRELELRYYDSFGNYFTIGIGTSAKIDPCASEWNIRSENFFIRYSAPCSVLLIHDPTLRYTEEQHRIIRQTITKAEMLIGSKTYYNVMCTKARLTSRHLGVYANQKNGIIMIENYDTDEIWILPEAINNYPKQLSSTAVLSSY